MVRERIMKHNQQTKTLHTHEWSAYFKQIIKRPNKNRKTNTHTYNTNTSTSSTATTVIHRSTEYNRKMRREMHDYKNHKNNNVIQL